jgi:hypothetical protein
LIVSTSCFIFSSADFGASLVVEAASVSLNFLGVGLFPKAFLETSSLLNELLFEPVKSGLY